MSKTLVLDTPIKINGNLVSELPYDGQKMTVDLYLSACARSAAATASGGASAASMKIKEVDYILHFYLGCACVIACNNEIDFADLERVSGFDVLDLTNIGSFFIYRKSAEPSGENDSENSGETTPDTSE